MNHLLNQENARDNCFTNKELGTMVVEASLGMLDVEPMPQKIRTLIQELKRAGFVNRGGKGSHRNFEHPNGARVTLSGKPGSDAKPYQARVVQDAIQESQK